MIEALAKVCKDHHAELASTLVHIFCTYNKVVPLITACLAKSVDSEGACVCVCLPNYDLVETLNIVINPQCACMREL